MHNSEKIYQDVIELIESLEQDHACLKTLPIILSAVNWQGTSNQLASIISQQPKLDSSSIHLILLSLGYVLEENKLSQTPLDHIAIAEINQEMLVILEDKGDQLLVHNGEQLSAIDRPHKVNVFKVLDLTDHSAKIRSWSWTSLQLFWPKIILALGISSILGFLALVIPLFTRHVYDMAIPSKSINTLSHLAFGAVLAMIFLFSFRFVRVRLAANICRSWTYKLTLSYGRKILNLPFLQSANQPYQNLIGRFKEIDAIRSFFISNSGLSLLDIPFLSISLITIFITGGWLVLVPLISIVIYALIIPFFNKLISQSSMSSSYAQKEKLNLEIDLARHAQQLEAAALKNSWLARYHDFNKISVKANRTQIKLSQLMQNSSYVLSQFTSLATMATGIYLVMDQKLTAGDLIAAMMLARRVTSPIQSSAMSFGRLPKFKNTLAQIDRYIPIEDEKSSGENIFTETAGFKFDNVVFRYNNSQDPALAGVSFESEAKSTTAIAGPNNSGKSTLINILTKTIDAQSGKAMIGTSNLKNINAYHFRDELSYAGEWVPRSHISIIDFLHELNPQCSLEKIKSLCEAHLFTKELLDCGKTLETELADLDDPYLKRHLSVMNIFIKDAPIVLLDINLSAHYPKEKALFIYLLEQIHGHKTIFFTTLCAELMQLADNALILDKGSVAHFGPIEKKPEVSA
ncbi:ABC transporter transmembrane domain-containing protein [Lentisphaera profundi]|uniref:ABC transporter transmembrane domain-containing protein n=1 Tax=Lentisphaera profundi TaxID=1658616 RepID=A0ABY7VZ22_9BACT|nr:ABC transporter transmembrane domain-containing protein [Lentisphaera profundi]WDE98513.1 ABC transporter transmembrane domain-containing protein [Lentisphaera profundi]